MFVYIKVLERDQEISNKVWSKPVTLANDLDLLIDAVFSNAYHLKVRSIRGPLNLVLYLNLLADFCGRGSDLAWGGPHVAKEESHCLCWDHCRFYVVNVDDGDRVIDLKYQKGQRDQDVQKTVTLCEDL